ncbi:MAG: hypothetical protein ACXVJD_00970 [Mucilaginibacter sp.]
MNWKLILQLSIFGLIMALGTVSLIPQNFEPAFWLVIFIFCAYVIAKVCSGRFFLHGFLTGLVNCIWITAAHCIFFQKYMANHKRMGTMLTDLPASLSTHPRLATAIMGLSLGILSAIILGLFALVASKLAVKK